MEIDIDKEAMSFAMMDDLGPAALTGGKIAPIEAYELGWLAAKRHAAQVAEPANFCARCGKRNVGIHTCTPPADIPAQPGIDQNRRPVGGAGSVVESDETRMDTSSCGGAGMAISPSGASVDSPAPCPHCGAAMTGDADFMTHPENDCWMSEWEYSQPNIAKWNRRASVDSVARDSQEVRYLLRNCLAVLERHRATSLAVEVRTYLAAMSPTKAGERKNMTNEGEDHVD